MPELPEVETVKRGLSALIIGKKIKSETHDWPKGFPNAAEDVSQFLIGATIKDVRRRAKVLLIDLDSNYTLVVHLKMTGQMVFRGEQIFGAGHPSKSLTGHLPDKSTRVTLTFTDNSKLFFNDQRKFGWIKLLPTLVVNEALTGSMLEAGARKQRAVEQAVQKSTVREPRSDDTATVHERLRQAGLEPAERRRVTEAVIDFFKKVGPEPLSEDFLPKHFIERVRKRSNTNIKAAILDQTIIAGIGNIYADEGLWGAKIHPSIRVRDLSDAQLKKLYEELRFVLNLSIEKGGSTDRNYVDAEGKRGSYLSFARVFRRQGKACQRCGSEIIKTRVAGRGTHLCPNCQKA
jgi:formamidopyrimidine-DNA glycosylase